MNAAPPPLPASPASCRKASCGCLPFLVFLLAVVCAASLLARRCGCGPKEDAGRVVLEFLEQNTRPEMQAHAARVTTAEVLRAAVRLSGTVAPQNVVDELRDRLAQNTAVTVRGPHLTITVHERDKSPAALAGFLADALSNDLIALAQERDRRHSQSHEAMINSQLSAADKARLELHELQRRSQLQPAAVAAAEADAAEIIARRTKARADLIMVEARLAPMKIEDPARSALSADYAALQNALASYEKSATQAVEEAHTRYTAGHEVEDAQTRYAAARALVARLRAELTDFKIRESVIKRPLRVISEARPVRVPDRRARQCLRLTTAASAVLLGALLLSALATRLLRRSA